jgi:hypothetical protein
MVRKLCGLQMEQGNSGSDFQFESAGVPEDKIVDPCEFGFVEGFARCESWADTTNNLRDYVELYDRIQHVKSVKRGNALVEPIGTVVQYWELPGLLAFYPLQFIATTQTDFDGQDRVHWWLVHDKLGVKILLWVDVFVESRGVLTFYPELKDALYRVRK